MQQNIKYRFSQEITETVNHISEWSKFGNNMIYGKTQLDEKGDPQRIF